MVEGVLDSASAGSLVDPLAEDFMNPKMQSNYWLQVHASISLVFG